MKKTLATILVLSLIVALSACGELATPQKQNSPTTAATQPNQAQPNTPVEQNDQKVTKEQAIELALLEAGISKDAATRIEAELDEKKNEIVWDVDIETLEKEYSYSIGAADGDVKETEVEKEEQPAVQETLPPTQPPVQETEPAQTQAPKQPISKESAIELALKAAGLTKEAVTDLEAELDKERDGLYWEVSFETREKEYDYDIHAYDGTVVKAEVEKEDDRGTVKETKPATQPPATEPAAPAVTKEQAIENALKAAGLTKEQVTELEAELDKERNGLYWEVSFETSGKEYDCDVNASNGTVVKVETEKEDEKPQATQPVQTAITKEQAVEIALNAAGLAKEAVRELEAELDEEGKVALWEVSFETATTEYSYEINAESGKIVKAESEKND